MIGCDRFSKQSTNLLNLEITEFTGRLRKRWEKGKTKEHFLHLIRMYFCLVTISRMKYYIEAVLFIEKKKSHMCMHVCKHTDNMYRSDLI